MPGVKETLPLLSKKYACYVLSGAEDSDAPAVKAAFAQLEMDTFFSGFLTPKELQAAKNERIFYVRALDFLGLHAWQTIMIGDNCERDIIPAKAVGLATILLGAHCQGCGHADLHLDRFDQLRALVPEGTDH